MPTYSENTFRGGFYTSKKIDGSDDRVYSAEDVRKPYDVIYSDGIRPDSDGTAGNFLKVVADGNLKIHVTAGFAKLGGAWFENLSNYSITLDKPSSANTRYDCVIIRNDDSDAVRAPSIYVKSVYNNPPTVSNLTRTDEVYEICVGYITINSGTTNLTSDNIRDTRGDLQLCPFMSGVGAISVRSLKKTYFSESQNQKDIPINIPQYVKDVDALTVSVEGDIFSEGSQYTILDNNTIRLAIGLPVVGTKVDFEVIKNVASTGAENVTKEVGDLQKQMAVVEDKLEHHYYCNGLNDNILIGDLVRTLLQGSGYGSVRLSIHGTFGAWQPAITNSSNNTSYWFDFSGVSTRKVVVDFTDSSQIITPVTDGTTNVIFYGSQINIVGANLIVNNTATNTSIVVIEGSAEIVNCENCRFWITADKYSYISRHGTFTNCRGSVTNSKYYSYCFYTQNLIRLFGGEYYAYTADTANCAVVGQTGADSVTIMYGVNAPTIDRVGYTQKNSVHHIGTAGNAGVICCTDLISTLPIVEHSGTDNFRGTIKINKPNTL